MRSRGNKRVKERVRGRRGNKREKERGRERRRE